MAKKKITKKNIIKQSMDCKPKHGMSCGSGGCAYVLGFIGALVYYIAQSTSFWMGVVGVLKALVWPAFLVYELMKFLGM